MRLLKKRSFWISLFILIAIGFCVIGNWNKITWYGSENPVEFSEAFLCRGPNKDGNPTEAVVKFSRNEWDEIYLCVYAIPNEQATLRPHWIYNKDGRSFSYGNIIRIYESQYLYFSLKESLEFHTTKYYFQDEIEYRDFPPGKYSAILVQIRSTVLTVNFELTN